MITYNNEPKSALMQVVGLDEFSLSIKNTLVAVLEMLPLPRTKSNTLSRSTLVDSID